MANLIHSMPVDAAHAERARVVPLPFPLARHAEAWRLPAARAAMSARFRTDNGGGRARVFGGYSSCWGCSHSGAFVLRWMAVAYSRRTRRKLVLTDPGRVGGTLRFVFSSSQSGRRGMEFG